MSEVKKQIYKKGMEYFHKETKEKLMFGKWNDNGTANCLNLKTKNFITLTKEQLDTEYTAYSKLDREYREKRKYEGW